MQEIIGLIFAIIAVIWVRKQDIYGYVTDKNSHKYIMDRILFPNKYDSSFINIVSQKIDSTFENGARFYFSIFMLSMIYTSLSFIFSLLFARSDYPLFIRDTTNNEIRAAFLLFVISSITCLICGRMFSKYIKVSSTSKSYLEKIERRIRLSSHNIYIYVYNLFCSTLFCASVYLCYENLYIAAIGLFASLLPSLLPQFRGMPFVIINRYPHMVAAGAFLGTLGLILVLISFSSDEIDTIGIVIIFTISVISSVLSSFGSILSFPVMDKNFYDKIRFVFPEGPKKILAATGRPSQFVGLYVSRCPGSFVLAVSIVLITIFISRSFLPETIVSAGAIMTTCFVFFAGATTFAGAGFFMFGSTVCVSIYMITTRPDLLFTAWAPVFLLWILIPLLNSVLDWARWSMARSQLHSLKGNVRLGYAQRFGLDVLVGFLAFQIILFSIICIFVLFTGIGRCFGYQDFINTSKLLNGIRSNLYQDGLWLVIMGATAFVPSIIMAVITIFSGLHEIVPTSIRRGLAEKLVNVNSAQQRDAIAWRLASIDVFGRVLAVGLFVVSISYTVFFMAPAIEFLSINVIVYAEIFGNSVVSWCLAN